MGDAAPLIHQDRLVALARLELANRQRRMAALGGGTHSEPAWTMLLDLYVAEQTRTKIQTTYLIEGSNLPHATGLRYVKYLVDLHLVTRSTIENDKRSKYVELTERGRVLLDGYLKDSLAALDGSGI